MQALCCKVSLGIDGARGTEEEQHLVRRVTFHDLARLDYDTFRDKVSKLFSLQDPAFRIAYRDEDDLITEIINDAGLFEAVSHFRDYSAEPASEPSTSSEGATNRVVARLFLLRGPSNSNDQETSAEEGVKAISEGLETSPLDEENVWANVERPSSPKRTRHPGPPVPPRPPLSYYSSTPCYPRPPSTYVSYDVPPGLPAAQRASSPTPSQSTIAASDEAHPTRPILPHVPLSAPPTYRTGSSSSSSSHSRSRLGPSHHHPPLEPCLELTPNGTIPDLPTLLADISRSRILRSNAPPASIHSSLTGFPARQAHCSACKKEMGELRYVCVVCGPRSLRIEEEEEDEDLDQARNTRLPLSPDASEVDEHWDLVHTPERRPSLGNQPRKGKARAVDSIATSTVSDEDDEDGDTNCAEVEAGYELCSECVEHHGVKHATHMAEHARRRQRGGGFEAEGAEGTEVRHAFAEVMRMPKSSLEGWREVDYEDDVHCSICGTGPVMTNRFKCLSCQRFELCLSCYRSVSEIHPVHSFLAIPDRPARPDLSPTPSTPRELHHHRSFGSASSATPEDMRLAILRARGVGGAPLSNGTISSRASLQSARHVNVHCFGCMREIVGARYRCAICAIFDLCEKCEAVDPPIASPDGRHDPTHIMLKIVIPLPEDFLHQAAVEAHRLNGTHLPHSSSLRQSCQQAYWDRTGRSNNPALPLEWTSLQVSPAPPPVYGAAPTAHLMNGNGVSHGIACRGCRKYINGIRWLCAQCGTTPTFDLCSDCERFSHVLHNPLHCFLRITQLISQVLPPLSQILPVLYDPSSPTRIEALVPDNRTVNGAGSDGTSEAVVLHQNVICDQCLEAIHGPWMRCCHCSTSFDLCQECLTKIEHEPWHVFVKFTRRVDMSLFRELTRISTHAPQPLLTFSVYS